MFQLYNDQKPELNGSLLALLDLTAATHRERGRPERESYSASLKAELTTALRGINPITLEKPAVRRHEMQNTIAFKVLQSLESQLRGHLQEASEALQRAEDLVSQILAAGIQKGLITRCRHPRHDHAGGDRDTVAIHFIRRGHPHSRRSAYC